MCLSTEKRNFLPAVVRVQRRVRIFLAVKKMEKHRQVQSVQTRRSSLAGVSFPVGRQIGDLPVARKIGSFARKNRLSVSVSVPVSVSVSELVLVLVSVRA